MIEVEQEQNQKIKVLLIGEPDVSLAELEGLCKTAGYEILRKVNLNRIEQNPVYGIGKGKADELSALAKELGADAIVFDFELSPRKQRNWEKLTKLAVFDRQEVILRIFADRAQTKEAVLQVNLARLEYSLPRLAHMYGDMARQRGGNYGSKGSGETQLELDQRQVRDKIAFLKKELKQVVKDRQTQRKRRSKTPCPTVAIIGYTNAGKSTLLNALTGAEVFVEDKLFATLDPTTRKLKLQNNSSILLTDTVGFISNLPHSLVDAFKSTLEEAATADLQLLVLDSSDPHVMEQYETVIKVLGEIDADSTKRLIVLNKTDATNPIEFMQNRLDELFPDAIKISAKNKSGFEDLLNKVQDALLGPVCIFGLPHKRHDLVKEIRAHGILINEIWQEDFIQIAARIGTQEGGKLIALLKPYLLS
ncbi:MAG: GTPase HflX [Treponema sp.]|nr:GTPase HflX [Treponema sp.]